MEEKIKLDLVSDVVCPWCIIGYKRLEKAIFELGYEEKLTIEWHPFELNPHVPTKGENLITHLSTKYGMSPDESRRTLNHITDLGAELDFNFDFFEEMKTLSTKDLHLLLDYAKEFGKQTELYLRFFKAYFSERKDVSDRGVLAMELQNVGLNVDEAMARLDDNKAQKQIQAQKEYWRNLGVTAVPTLFFKLSHPIVGAQSVSDYKQLLSQWVGGNIL